MLSNTVTTVNTAIVFTTTSHTGNGKLNLFDFDNTRHTFACTLSTRPFVNDGHNDNDDDDHKNTFIYLRNLNIEIAV